MNSFTTLTGTQPQVMLYVTKRVVCEVELNSWYISSCFNHDDVIKLKHFPRYWPFVRGIHRSPVNSPHKGQWRGALMFSLICTRINRWVNNGEAGDLRRHRAHYDVTVMNCIFKENNVLNSLKQLWCLTHVSKAIYSGPIRLRMLWITHRQVLVNMVCFYCFRPCGLT